MNRKKFSLKPTFTNENSADIINDISTRSKETVSIGETAGKNSQGTNNVFIGFESGFNSVDINDSVFIGSRTGFNVKSSQGNVYIGAETASDNSFGSFNTIAGYNSGSHIQDGELNTIFGTKNVTNDISTFVNNSIFGNNSGKNLISGEQNVVIGNQNINNVENALSNIYIGVGNVSIQHDTIQNSIIMGNNNSITNNSLSIGNYNSIKSESSISIGSRIDIRNIATINDPLIQYDPLIKDIARQRLSISDIVITPENNNNLIYQSLVRSSIPIRSSLSNNIDVQTTFHTLPTLSVSTDKITNVYRYKILEYIPPIENNTVYQIDEPIISINSTNTYRNEIDLKTISISNHHEHVNFYVTKQPKYGSITKLKYNKNETIYINEYLENGYIQNDTIEISTITSFPDSEYSILSKKSLTINLLRKTYNPPLSPTLFYTGLINVEWFFPKTSIVINKNSNKAYVDNVIKTTSSFKTNTNVLIDTTSDTTVFVDNKEVHIKHLNNWIDQTFENKTYRITLLPNNRIEHDFIQDLNYKIYIVRPPKYGYLLHNIYQHDLTDFRYILKSIDQTNSDSITVKFLSQDLTKTTEHTYTVIIENFIVNLDRIYWNASQNIINPITVSMLQNGFFWNSTHINHINRQDILPKINNENFPIFQYDYTISKNISLGVNNLELTIYPYSSVSIETALRELILNKPYVSNTSFYVIKQPNYGSVDPTVSYFNTTNRDDNFQILIAVNPYNASRDNVVDVNIKIINTFEITFSPQYLYNENVEINTISVKDVDINDIYIQNLENVNDSIISIKDSRISRSNSGITKYRLLFGQTDYSIDTFPEINHVVYIDRFHIEYSIPNHVSDINKVCYLLENDRTYNNLNISFILNINTIFDNIAYNRYSFYLVLSDTDFNIHFTESGIYINNVLIDSLGIIPINTTVVVEVSSEIIKIGGIEHRHNIDAYLFNKIELLYTLSDNIQNVDNENYKLTNYTVDVNITNLTITYKIDNGQNLMIGGDVVCSGYNNICLGNNFQSFGNKSIIIGNTIGNTDFSNISIDNGLHESIIIGNTCFNQSPVKNIISIGNNIYNDITLDTINDYSKLSTFFSKNPVLIGNELKYNSDHIININNSIIETDNYISIGKDKKDVLIGNSNIIDLITEQSLDFDHIVKNKQDKIEFQEPLYNSNNIISVDLSSKQDIIDFVYPLSNNDNNIVVDLTHKQDVLEFTYPLKNNSNVIQLDLSNLQTDLQFHEPLSNIDDHVYIDLSHKQDLLDISYPLCNINNVLSIDLSTKQDLLEFEYPLSNTNGTVNVDISSKQNVLTYSDPINIVDDHISIDLTKKQDILYFQKPLNSFNNIVSIDLSSKQDVLTFQEPLKLENTNVSIDISNKQDLLTFQFPLVSNIDGTVSLDISNKQDKLIFKEPILKNENNEISIDLNSKQDLLVFEEPLSVSGNKVNIDLSNKQDNLTFNTPLINNNNVIDLDLTHKQDKLSFEYPLVIDNTSNKLGIDLDHKQDVLVFTDTFVSNIQNKISIDLDHKQNKLSFSDPLKYNDQNLSIDLSHKQDTLQFEHPLSNIDGIVSIKQSIIEFEFEYPLSNVSNVVSIDVNSLQNKLIFENPLYQEDDIIKVDLSDINNTYNALNDHVSNVLQNEINNKQQVLTFDEPLSISNSNTVSIDLTQKQDIFTVQDPLYFNNNVLSIDTRELAVDITKITQFNGTWNDLYGKPELFPTSWELIQQKPYIFSGSWYDLLHTPAVFPTSWDIIENKPTYFKANWENIDNKPLSFIADWNNVFNKPTFFNTSWDIIQNKPNLFETEWSKVQNIPTLFDTEWDRVQNKPTLFDTNWDSVQDKPSLFNTEWNRIQNKPELYSDTDFDSRLSSVISANSVIKFLNGVLYSDLSDYYTKAQVDINTTNIYNTITDVRNSINSTQGKITTNNPLNIDSANLLSLNIDSSSLEINENNELSVIAVPNLWRKSNTDIYYNDGKIGIGSVNPEYSLHVVGDVNISSGSKYKIDGRNLSISDLVSGQTPTNGQVLSTDGSGNFSFIDATSSVWIESSGDIYRSSGNIGIGTNNPTAKLHVVGDVTISSGSKYKIDGRNLSISDLVSEQTPTSGQVLSVDDSGNFLFIDTTSSVWTESSDNIYRSLGNVGIGTNNPTEKLDVAGDINISSGSKYKIDGRDLSLFDLNIIDGTSGQVLSTNADGTFSFIDSGGNWTTSGNNIYYTDGNVGIGTNNPTEKLDVAGNVNISSGSKYKIDGRNLSISDLVSGQTPTSGQILTANTDGTFSFKTFHVQSSSNWTTSGNDIYRSSGNVGIGTSAPYRTLHIYGTLALNGANNKVGFDFDEGSGFINFGTHMTTRINLNAQDIYLVRSGLNIADGTKYKINNRDLSLTDLNISDGTSGQVLSTNADGTFSFIDISSSGSGSDINVSALHAQWTISGGGTVTWNGSKLKWTHRIILIPIEKSEISSDGHINIECPTSGTITYYNSSNHTTTSSCDANGISIGHWEAIYYEIAPGQSAGSSQSRFRLVHYANSTWKPDENWILIAMRNSDLSNSECIKWMPGQVNIPTINIPTKYGSIEYSNRTGSFNKVYFSNKNNYLSYPTGSSGIGELGSIQINGKGKGNWEGYSIDGRVAFLHDTDSSDWGIYNDVNNEWMIYGMINGYVRLYYNNSSKLETTSSGMKINGNIDMSGGANNERNIVLSQTMVTDNKFGISFSGAVSGSSYGLFRTAGTGWSNPYHQIELSCPTGLILNPGSSYGKSYMDVQGAGLRITDSNGKLGLGLSNPTQFLHVEKSHGAISDSGSENNNGLTDMVYFYSTADGDILRVKSNTTRSDTSLFRCCNSSQNDVFKVCANGNVGIGVHNPSQKLHVQGHIYTSETIGVGNSPDTDETEITDISTSGTTPNDFYVSMSSPGDLNDIHGNYYTININNGYQVELYNWRYIRDYARGFLNNNTSFTGQVKIKGLTAGCKYKYRIFGYTLSHISQTTAKVYVNNIFVSDFVANTSTTSKITNTAFANSNGEIHIYFDPQSNAHVHLSYISCAKVAEKLNVNGTVKITDRATISGIPYGVPYLYKNVKEGYIDEIYYSSVNNKMRGHIKDILALGLKGKGSSTRWYHFTLIVYPPSTWGDLWDYSTNAVMKEDIILERRSNGSLHVRQSGIYSASGYWDPNSGLHNKFFFDVSRSSNDSYVYGYMRFTIIDLNS